MFNAVAGGTAPRLLPVELATIEAQLLGVGPGRVADLRCTPVGCRHVDRCDVGAGKKEAAGDVR